MKRVYLDYAAATPLDPRVKEAMDDFNEDCFANPAGLHHEEGRLAKKHLEDSRKTIAQFIGTHPPEIVFTSSATESNNLAILGAARANKKLGRHLVTTAAEHASVLNVFKKLEDEDFEVGYLPVDEFGMVSAEQIKNAIRPDTILVSVILGSNEIGTINPIKQIVKRVRGEEKGKRKEMGLPYFHTDAAQAAPHIRIDAKELGVDLMSLAAGKMYGPKGSAVLYVRHGMEIDPITLGGPQENNLRAGTPDVLDIVGFAKAAEIVRSEGKKESNRLVNLRDKIIKEVTKSITGIMLNGHPKERLANNISFSIPGVDSESLVAVMDDAGFAISTRSACDTASNGLSRVIKAIGRTDEEARGTVRITLGRFTKTDDADRFTKEFISQILKLK